MGAVSHSRTRHFRTGIVDGRCVGAIVSGVADAIAVVIQAIIVRVELTAQTVITTIQVGVNANEGVIVVCVRPAQMPSPSSPAYRGAHSQIQVQGSATLIVCCGPKMGTDGSVQPKVVGEQLEWVAPVAASSDRPKLAPWA